MSIVGSQEDLNKSISDFVVSFFNQEIMEQWRIQDELSLIDVLKQI